MTLAEKYVYEIYKTKSFSTAAKRLFISQPALSATVARLEKELGFRIFDRTVTPLKLTAEGVIYIETLSEIEETRRIMKKRILHLSETNGSKISLGGSTYIGQTLLPFLCGEHFKRYPDTRFSLDMSIYIGPMLERLTAHSIELVAVYGFDDEKFSFIPLFEERRVIAIHKSLLRDTELLPYALTRRDILTKSYGEDKELDDLSVFSSFPFLPHRSDTVKAPFIAQLLPSSAISEHTIPNIPSLTSNYYMMCAGLGAAITTETIVAAMRAPTDDILFFVPKTNAARAPFALIHAADRDLSPAAARFVDTAKELCQDGAILSLFL